jgi:hypothetical protein
MEYIGGILGNPLYMDMHTSTHSRGKFSHICVVIEVKKVIHKILKFGAGNGEIAEVETKPLWIPPRCAICKVFGQILCINAPSTSTN